LVAAMTGLVADAVSAGLLVVNAEGRVVWVNAALAGVVGVTAPAANSAAAAAERADPGALPAGGGTGLAVSKPAEEEPAEGEPPGEAASAGGRNPLLERLGEPLPEPTRALARRAVAEARLPLSDLVPGAAPVDVRWTTPDGAERLLWLRCQRLTPPGDSWADGLVLYELFDITDVVLTPAADPAPDQASEQLGWTAPAPGDEAWRGTPEWDQAAWGKPITDETVAMARPPRPPIPPPGEEAPAAVDGSAAALDGTAASQSVSGADRLARIEALTRTGTWEWDLVTGAVSYSRNQLALLGFGPDETPDARQLQELIPTADLDLITTAVTSAIRTADTFTFIHRLLDRSGRGERVFECFGEVITDAAGRPCRVLGTAHDITDLHRVHQELEHLAERDSLTGLFNRRAVTRALREHVAELPEGREGSLLIIDVDHFKDVNDLRGHAVGDIVMRGLAGVLRDQLPDAVLGRLGGDEFAVLLPAGDGAAGLAVAERLCQAVARTPIPADDLALRVTVSIGVVPLAQVENENSALAQADLALYESKDSGRDRARLFSEAQFAQAERRVSVTQRVRAALEAGTLGVDALPLVDLAARRVIGYELLVRLRDGLKPELSAREFLEPVERTELVLRLDRWVLSQAVAALAADGPHGSLYLHVNISARSVEDAGFGDFVLDALRDSAVNPSRLGLEVAERSTLVSLEPARRLAEKLTAAGCRFILDDFGVGMGSVVHLRTLPFSGVKIDGDFVRQADVNAQDMALVDAVVRIARTLGMYTIAENVDRESLARVLADIGVDYAQGFHIGPPQPLAELLAERPAADSAAGLPSAVWEHTAAFTGELEQAELERAELARVERERAELERAELERAELERAELAHVQRERAEFERAELERVQRERAALERAERERAEHERLERERAELERVQRERAELERAARERAEFERAELERAERERAEHERLELERAELERLDRERVERGRAVRDQLESERRRAEYRGSVSWDHPGLDDLDAGDAGTAPPYARPATFPGLSRPAPDQPTSPPGMAGGPAGTPTAGGPGTPGWSTGPATLPPRFPAYPSMSPPPGPSSPVARGDDIPDFPPAAGLTPGGPPSGGLPLSGGRLVGGGYGLGGFGGGRVRDGHPGTGRGDGYEGGGYGGYDTSRPDPLGLDRVGYLGRDPLFGTRVPGADGTRVPDADGTGVPGADGTHVPDADGAAGRGNQTPAESWGIPGAAGPSPWDIVSVGGVVAAGPGPDAGRGPTGGPGGTGNGLDIGAFGALGPFDGANGWAADEPSAPREDPGSTGGTPSSADGGLDRPGSLGGTGTFNRAGGFREPGRAGASESLGSDGGPGPGGGLVDWPGRYDRYVGSPGHGRPEPDLRGRPPGGAGPYRVADEPGQSAGGRRPYRQPDPRDDGGAATRHGEAEPWNGPAGPRADRPGVEQGPGASAQGGDEAAEPVTEPVAQDTEAPAGDGGPAAKPAVRDSAETQVVTMNNSPATGGPFNGLYRWP